MSLKEAARAIWAHARGGHEGPWHGCRTCVPQGG